MVYIIDPLREQDQIFVSCKTGSTYRITEGEILVAFCLICRVLHHFNSLVLSRVYFGERRIYLDISGYSQIQRV